MKHWKETAQVTARLVGLADARERAALATVIRVDGSAYRRPGAKLLIEEGGRTTGNISGGCLEADVREVARGVMRSGSPRRLRYETGSDDRAVFGLGLGCSGSVEVFVQTATEGEMHEVASRVRELLQGERPFALATAVEGPAGRVLVLAAEGVLAGSMGDPALDGAMARERTELLARGEQGLLSRSDPTHPGAGSTEVFVDVLTPPPHLVLFGASDDALPLCAYASDAGFRVSVVDHRKDLLSAERFPGAFLLVARPEDGALALDLGPRTYAVVKTHSFGHDWEWVRRLVATEVAYIGLLGPRARAEAILDRLPAGHDERVFAPVGLDLGADGPEQVALSVVAELLAVRSSREPRSLREKGEAIHAR